jgi:ABC-type antimicrobial peptide transport system permease subunit
VVAAFTFSAGVADAAEHPERFGQPYQIDLGFGYGDTDLTPPSVVLPLLEADQDVTAILDTRFTPAQAGGTSVNTFQYDSAGRALPIALTDGAAPRTADDIVVAPTTARQLGLGVGSTISLNGKVGAHSYRISGLGFVPQTAYNDYNHGAWLSPAGYRQLFTTGFLNHEAFLAVRPDADVDAVLTRLNANARSALGPQAVLFMSKSALPKQVVEIRDVRVLPLVLGGFLALLAVGAVGHALATAVRRRRRDVAVLRALGMTRRQSRELVVTQASVLAVIGLLFGIPLGLALGRTLWRLVSDTTPLQYIPPVAFWTLVLIVPLALVIANLLAALPGRLAARMHVADVLRAE